MNKYKAIFYFDGRWVPIEFNSNQLANASLPDDDDILTFRCGNDGQDFETIKRINGKDYVIVFSPHNPNCVHVYNVETEEDDGLLVQANIPWLLLQVIGKDDNILYDINYGRNY
jgi:hypothetical protein